MMKGLLIWFATLGMLLLALWAGAHARGAERPVSPSIYTDTMEPKLPAVPEAQPEASERGPAFTF